MRGEEVTFFDACKSANMQISIFVRRKSIYFRTCGSFKSAKNFESANRKSTNYISANHKKDWVRNSVNCQICGICANLTNYLGLQIYDLRNLFAEHWNVGWIEKEAANMWHVRVCVHKRSPNKHRWQTERGIILHMVGQKWFEWNPPPCANHCLATR